LHAGGDEYPLGKRTGFARSKAKGELAIRDPANNSLRACRLLISVGNRAAPTYLPT
jgi:hypothetical protein